MKLPTETLKKLQTNRSDYMIPIDWPEDAPTPYKGTRHHLSNRGEKRDVLIVEAKELIDGNWLCGARLVEAV